MWHEARKQERKIRGMMVDYKRRAERRREYYEKIKADPTQFLQLHGRRCKVHLDPAVAQAADSPANMMPWQGHSDNLIDRFDGRAHLDHITEYRGSTDVERPAEDDIWEERQASYERYRILVENDFLGLPEEKFLMQIYLEEQFGPIGRAAEEDKKKSSEKKAAIGYVYEDSTPQPAAQSKDDDEAKKDSDSDIDLDVTVNVEVLTTDQSKEMNEQSFKYGMVGEDFIRFMVRDKEEAESLRLAKEAEEEKAMYSGRKSRRERRAFREKKLQGRKISPPSYAARESPTYDPYKKRAKSPSRSRSRSPVDAGKITYITCFGGDISDESGTERHPRPGFVSSLTTVMGPSLPGKSVPHGGEAPSLAGVTAAGSTPHLPRFRGTGRRSVAGSQATSSTSITSSTSAVHSRSRSRSSSGSRSRSRTRERFNRCRNRKETNRKTVSHTESHSRSPIHSRYPGRKDHRRHPRTRSYSRSGSSDSRQSLPRSHSRSRSRSRSSSSSKSRSRSNSTSSRGHSSTSTKRYSSKAKSHSRSPNGRSSSPSQPIQSSSTAVGTHAGSGVPGGASTSAAPSATVSRYYGRRRDLKDESSSSTSLDEDDDNSQESQQVSQHGSSSSTFKTLNFGGMAVYGTKAQKLTPQERLKRRMQAALNKQYKADKKAEMKKIEKQEQERQDREEELRELAIKLRRRERERRHRRQDSGGRERSSHHHRRGRSRSRSYSSSRSGSASSESGSRSQSRSPKPRGSRSRSRSVESPANSQSQSSSDSSEKRVSKHSSSGGRRYVRRSRSPLVHY